MNPDLDGLAGAAAYAEFLKKTGKDAVVGIIGKVHDEAAYMMRRFVIESPPIISDASDFDEVILVDASDINGLEGKIDPVKVIEIIDHRKIHEADKFPNAVVHIELVGAAATLIAEKFIQNKIKISQQSAILVYGAIISNTLNFKGGVTTDRDRKAAEWLNAIAQLPESFAKELFEAKSDLSGVKLGERIEGDFAWFILGGKKVGIAQIEMVGAKHLAEERREEIVSTLNKIKNEMSLDFIFQNTIELEDAKNILITDNEPTKTLLEKVLGVKFFEDIAETEQVLMRKQIVPLLKEEMER